MRRCITEKIFREIEVPDEWSDLQIVQEYEKGLITGPILEQEDYLGVVEFSLIKEHDG